MGKRAVSLHHTSPALQAYKWEPRQIWTGTVNLLYAMNTQRGCERKYSNRSAFYIYKMLKLYNKMLTVGNLLWSSRSKETFQDVLPGGNKDSHSTIADYFPISAHPSCVLFLTQERGRKSESPAKVSFRMVSGPIKMFQFIQHTFIYSIYRL